MTRRFDGPRHNLRKIAGAAILLVVLIAAPATGRAADAADQAAYDAAFDAMQHDPGNSDKALTYAEAAIKVGDLEGAIGALERLLIFNPDLPRMRLELGVLYYRLGSYDLARSYLGQLAERSDLPEDVRAKVQEYLGQIDKQSAPSRLTGSLLMGIRYQTNADTGPTNGATSIGIFGTPIITTAPTAAAKHHDLNFFGAATLNHVYDFQTADPMQLETNFTTYGAKQFRQTLYDLSLLQIDSGPRFGLPNLLPGSSIRPYAVADYLSLGGTNFMNSYGGGLNYVAPVLDRLFVEVNFEVQNRQYWEDPLRPRITNRNGDYISARATPQYAITDNQLVALTAELDRTLSVQGYERNTQFVTGPTYQIRFDPPVQPFEQPWIFTASFNRIWRAYSAPDPLVDMNDTRNDREWVVGASLSVGIVQNLAAVFAVQNIWEDSTIVNYKYTNLMGSAALSLQF
jgi:hypothetical protein